MKTGGRKTKKRWNIDKNAKNTVCWVFFFLQKNEVLEHQE